MPFVMISKLATPKENKIIQDITNVQVSIVAVCVFLRTSLMPVWIFEMVPYKTSYEHIRMIFFFSSTLYKYIFNTHLLGRLS